MEISKQAFIDEFQQRIRANKERINKQIFDLDRKHSIEKNKLLIKLTMIQEQECSHPRMKGMQYTRYCPDCGYSEDTTWESNHANYWSTD